MAPVFKGLAISPEMQTRLAVLPSVGGSFANSVGRKLELKEVDVRKRERDGKVQAQVTYALAVGDDMLNIAGTMHGGCAAYLVDLCTSIALVLLSDVMGKPTFFVSHALHTTFHAPMLLGTTLEIVNTTVAYGARTVSAVTEIWDVTNGRLCATGAHHKMVPSQLQAKL
ncbi:HotDog domain-containing protein [Earliella scabrosa]|nr:HotDog domain-containing protein [Earliella scabrosa]